MKKDRAMAEDDRQRAARAIQLMTQAAQLLAPPEEKPIGITDQSMRDTIQAANDSLIDCIWAVASFIALVMIILWYGNIYVKYLFMRRMLNNHNRPAVFHPAD